MLKHSGCHIRLFLADGSPSGLITAEILNWTGKVLSFPRGLLPDVLKRPEMAKTGLYFLVGSNPESVTRPLVYVGESDHVGNRLKQHDTDEEKDFFEQVALVVNKDENLTKSHVRYLEYRLMTIIREIDTATLHNGNQGSPVTLPEAELSDMERVIQQLLVLMPVLGFTFLQAPPKRNQPQTNTLESAPVEEFPTFELRFLGGKIQADAYEAEGQFVVMAGSICRHPEQVTDALKNARYAYILDDLQQSLETGLLIPVESPPCERVRLTRDKAFKSPSRAASFVCGNPMNGLQQWKVKGTGQTYGEWRTAQFMKHDHKRRNPHADFL